MVVNDGWIIWLVVWNIFYLSINIWDVILPIDEFIFFKMVQTTNQRLYKNWWEIIIYGFSNGPHPRILFELDEKKSFFFQNCYGKLAIYRCFFPWKIWKKLHLSMGFSMDFPCPGWSNTTSSDSLPWRWLVKNGYPEDTQNPTPSGYIYPLVIWRSHGKSHG